MEVNPNQKVLIYGVGLMGASLALSIKSTKPNWKRIGVVRSERSKEICLEKHILDEVYLEEEFFERANQLWESLDWIVFGTPVHMIRKQIQYIPTTCKAFITDMGSTKGTIVDACESHFVGEVHQYVSSHPMCGSENSGPEHAIPQLFENKLCIITPLPRSSPEAIEKITEFWKDLGMVTYVLHAKEHDRVLAYLSHTPHILSSLMAIWASKNVGEENLKSPQPIMGGGFRDMVRIAGSNPEMWASIMGENKNFILDSLKTFQKNLEETIQILEKEDPVLWRNFFQEAKKAKDHLVNQKQTEDLKSNGKKEGF